jgi:hypothetical protein
MNYIHANKNMLKHYMQPVYSGQYKHFPLDHLSLSHVAGMSHLGKK